MFARILRDTFVLAVILIVIVYYVGANQLAKTGFSGAKDLLYAGTGRNAQGQFQPYPSGA